MPKKRRKLDVVCSNKKCGCCNKRAMKLEQITPILESYEDQGCNSGLSLANGTMKAVWNFAKFSL